MVFPYLSRCLSIFFLSVLHSLSMGIDNKLSYFVVGRMMFWPPFDDVLLPNL